MKKLLMLVMAMLLSFSAAMAEDDKHYDAIEHKGGSDWISVQREGLWGVVDKTGTLVIHCEWDEIGQIGDSLIAVCRDGLWGYIDLQGNVLLEVIWEELYGSIQEYYAVGQGGMYGLADEDGHLILPLKEGQIGEERIGEESYIFRGTDVNARKYYVIENGVAKEIQVEKKTVTYAVPEGYDMTYMGSSVGWWVESKTTPSHYRFADQKGQFLTPERWDEVSGFYCGLSMVKKDGKIGFVNEAGEITIPLVYDGAWTFSDNMALVRQGEERFWIDTGGNRLFDWKWAQGSKMRDGMAIVRTKDGLYGVIDTQGTLIIPCEWDGVEYPNWPFMKGEIMQVEKDGLWGFINKQGVLLSNRLYDPSAINAEWYGGQLFLLENGILSIYRADGAKVY